MLQWRDKIELVKSVNKNASLFFQNTWKEESCWQWLVFLEAQMTELPTEKRQSDFDVAYFYSMVSCIDFDVLQKIDSFLHSLIGSMFVGRSNTVSTVNVSKEYRESLFNAAENFGLNEKGVTIFVSKTTLLSVEKQELFLKNLAEFGIWVDTLNVFFPLISAALLFHRPAHVFANIENFKKTLNDALTSKQKVDLWPAIIRYFSQAFYSPEGDINDEVIFYLVENPFDTIAQKNKTYEIFYRMILFIAFKNFSYFNIDNRLKLLNLHIWSAIQFGIPIQIVLKTTLAQEPLIDSYVRSSGQYANEIQKNVQKLYLPGQENTTVSSFITQFTNQYQKNDFDTKIQMNFVETEVKTNHWPLGFVSHLSDLLFLYIHLRECDLIDYHGLLEDSGVRKSPYDFKELMQKDLNEREKKEITEYFFLQQRPLKLKMFLIVAFQSVDYKEDPFLSRMLVLNELYANVYGSPYSPLVIFDDSTGDWKFRKEFPVGPWQFVSNSKNDQAENNPPQEEVPTP